MVKDSSHRSNYPNVMSSGTLLASDGNELEKEVFESSVYLGADGFVYHLIAQIKRGAAVHVSIAGKRLVGEYLRWVDGLFRPGDLPDHSNGVHYRAAKKLRELL